ncbi:MAG: isochorismatase hydrolase [Frankiales bacterium]|nr:isochorismatase hydrolase [Frankiales bacterium]
MTGTAEVYARAGFGGVARRGSAPALLVVDFSRGFTDPDAPTGADMTDAVLGTAGLIEIAHGAGAPVIFTTIAYSSPHEGQAWLRKSPGLAALQVGSPAVEIDPRLPREADDALVVKHGASAFFGTGLAALLAGCGVDTVIVCGATTSGCVRASVVDAVQGGYDVLVPRECVADRAQGPHEASLFDMQAKYADVIAVEEAARYLADQTAPITVLT